MSDRLTRQEISDYLSLFPQLVLEMLDAVEDVGQIQQWAGRVLYRNVPNNEMLHGLATSVALKHLVREPAPSLVRDAHILGWCLQMFASCYFILDDIFDNAQTRHYKPCWHLVDGVGGKQALNDVMILESCVYHLLRKHFGERPFYTQLLEVLHDLSFKMGMSQNLETQLSSKNSTKPLEDRLTWKQYETLVNYKMCYYPTCIHVLCALHLAGIEDLDLHSRAKSVLRKIDFQFQVRDDYLDLYGDNEKNGREAGNDVEMGRCSWNVVKALEAAEGGVQREALLQSYGKDVETVRKIYDDLKLPALFAVYESKEYDAIMGLIAQLPPTLPAALFTDMMWASFPDKQQRKGKRKSESDSNLAVSDITDFLGVFPELIVDFLTNTADLAAIEPYITRLFHHNIPHGKKTRGLTVPYAFKLLLGGGSSSNAGVHIPAEEMHKANVLGWSLEILQAVALVADDVMDGSSMRRGRPCWYKLPGVGLEALNDATILESAIYKILRRHFGEETYYAELLELMQGITYKTALGQALDTSTGLSNDIMKFTRERYALIVKYKTSYYTFVLPIALAFSMMGLPAKQLLTDSFLLGIGHLFQVQDDYLDCFGDAATTGKVGTDIADGKCSWLAVEALHMATESQKELLRDNYGKGVENTEAVEVVKALYADLGLPQLFHKYEEEMYAKLEKELQVMELTSEGHRNLLLQMLHTTCKRKS